MNKKKKIWTTIFTIALILLILVLGFVAWYLFQDYKARQHQQEVQEAVISTSSVSSVSEDTATVSESEDMEITGDDSGKDGEATEVPDSIFVDMENPINFTELQGINTELYSWLEVPDTVINYPVAQRVGDDGFYLHHDMYGDAVFAGCLYTEDCNSTDYTDPNTIIYGHNMKNETMFHQLHLFEDQSFFDSHEYFYIYSPDCVRVYQIFAAYTYDNRRILDSFDFSDPTAFQSYLDGIMNGTLDGYQGGWTRSGITLNADDRIVTLETCVGAGGEQRWLVQGVLVSEGGKAVNNHE